MAMRLFIDTSSNEQTEVRLGNERLVRRSRQWSSQVVLPMIERLLRKQRKTLSDVTAIEVATGPGSFTGLRVGVAVSQALGYALNITVNGKMVAALDLVEPGYEG